MKHATPKVLLQAVWTTVFCLVVSAVISFFAPYYVITCSKTEEGVNCHIQRVLFGAIPLDVTDIQNLRSVEIERRAAARPVKYDLQLVGDEEFVFKADRAKSSEAQLRDFVESPGNGQFRFSDGHIFFGLYIPSMGILFGLMAAVIYASGEGSFRESTSQHRIAGLATSADTVTFLTGAFVTAGVAGFCFVYIVDVIRAPWWCWGLLISIAGIGGLANVFRVRFRTKETQPDDPSSERNDPPTSESTPIPKQLANAPMPPEVMALQAEAEEALAEMESVAAEVEASPNASDFTVTEMERDLASHRASLAFTDFSLNNFDDWQPGRLCRWRREVLSARKMASTVLASGFGWGIVGLVVTPLAILLLALVAVTILKLFPGDNRVIHLVITDLFAFQSTNLFVEYAFMFLAIFAWMWVRLDCAFSPREIVLEWNEDRLTVRGRRDVTTARLSHIKALVIRPVLTHAASKPDAASSPATSSAGSPPMARLEARLSLGSVVLIETDPSELSTKNPSGRLLSLAKPLARALGVEILHEDPVYDNFDVVGYPKKSSLRNACAIWRNSDRGPKLATLLLLATLVTCYGFRAHASYHEHSRVDRKDVSTYIMEMSSQIIEGRAS
jgi:hypothetical protein